MVMKYNITRNGELIKSFIEIDDETFDDLGLEEDSEYDYTVEIAGQPESKASVSTKTESGVPKTTIVVSNKELTWINLPAANQINNGSLNLLSTEVKDSVPVVVETGEMVERHNHITKELELVPETVVQYETRATYTYEADFYWNNEFSSTSLIKDLKWLVDVLQFKDNKLSSGKWAFKDIPATKLTALPDLDTSNLANMHQMFLDASLFNQSLDNFDTSGVTAMSNMWCRAVAFNQPLNFDTSSVTTMYGMFLGANAFNQPLNWNTSSVTNMDYMFKDAKGFNQNISHWCVQQIFSKPSNFDTNANSGFRNKTAKQPNWSSPC